MMLHGHGMQEGERQFVKSPAQSKADNLLIALRSAMAWDPGRAADFA